MRIPFWIVGLCFSCLASIALGQQGVVNPDGSMAGPGPSPPPSNQGFTQDQSVVTVTFDDLGFGEAVARDRYLAQGLLVETGPDSWVSGYVAGSGSGPCNSTSSIMTEPFVGPSILLRFPEGASSVTLESGDFGPSDEDTIMVAAYSDDALTSVVAFQSQDLAGGSGSSCLSFTVSASTIKAVEVISRGVFANSVFVDTVSFEPIRMEVRLEKRGRTQIEEGNNYSENTRLRATVVYPAGHPRAGQRVRSFNGQITFSEEAGTTYYDGANGATLLPQTVNASNGEAEILLKSVSDAASSPGPIDAQIRAEGPGLTPQAATNPLSVDQWVDENRDGFIDWLDDGSEAIHDCARDQDGEVETVQGRVTSLSQESDWTVCGTTPIQVANRSPIFISPICGMPNVHRLNTDNELSTTVMHEGRHAWQLSQRSNTRRGINDDGNRATLSNDDDLDFLLEVVDFASANGITEAANGTGDNADDGAGAGIPFWEVDAETHGRNNRNLCPW
jgi:hypothetical protein